MRPIDQTEFPGYKPLKCKKCKIDLLNKNSQQEGIIVFETVADTEKEIVYIKDIYWSCKGSCERKLKQETKHKGYYTGGWENLEDFLIPSHYIDWIVNLLDRINSGKDVYEQEAFENLKHLIHSLAHFTLKKPNKRQKERDQILSLFT